MAKRTGASFPVPQKVTSGVDGRVVNALQQCLIVCALSKELHVELFFPDYPFVDQELGYEVSRR
ncbi:MAG TPA: hypothetical protein VH985_03155 [Candidatus Binatia bacterium]